MKYKDISMLIAICFLLTSCTTVKIENEAAYSKCDDNKLRVVKGDESTPQCIDRWLICQKENNIIIKENGSYVCEENIAVSMSYPIGYLLTLYWFLGL